MRLKARPDPLSDRQKKKAIDAYKQFVAEGKSQPSPWSRLRNQIYLGSDEYVTRMQDSIDSDQDLSEIPRSQRRPTPLSLSEYEANTLTRDEAILEAYKSGGYTQKTIGGYFGLQYSRISRIVSKAKGKT